MGIKTPPQGGVFDDFGFPGRRKLEIVDFSRNLEKTPGNPRKTRILAGFPNTNSDFLAKTGGCTLPPPYRGGGTPPPRGGVPPPMGGGYPPPRGGVPPPEGGKNTNFCKKSCFFTKTRKIALFGRSIRPIWLKSGAKYVFGG